jgi:hypothetical protein
MTLLMSLPRVAISGRANGGRLIFLFCLILLFFLSLLLFYPLICRRTFLRSSSASLESHRSHFGFFTICLLL